MLRETRFAILLSCDTVLRGLLVTAGMLDAHWRGSTARADVGTGAWLVSSNPRSSVSCGSAFWVLVHMDRTVSSNMRRPCALQYDDFDIAMSIPVDDDYWEHPTHSFQQPPNIPYILRLAPPKPYPRGLPQDPVFDEQVADSHTPSVHSGGVQVRTHGASFAERSTQGHHAFVRGPLVIRRPRGGHLDAVGLRWAILASEAWQHRSWHGRVFSADSRYSVALSFDGAERLCFASPAFSGMVQSV
ncbi:hypothetical protein C8R43DRAFT_942633 [Mycena crocata]|nr:hypothetical protein C8R43DRAFT_942633 [Mycena crocata]